MLNIVGSLWCKLKSVKKYEFETMVLILFNVYISKFDLRVVLVFKIC